MQRKFPNRRTEPIPKMNGRQYQQCTVYLQTDAGVCWDQNGHI